MQAYRIERDSLGEVKVPAEALYGAQTQRALENFPISGYRFPRPFIRALGIIKKAAAEANKELGLLEPRIADAIIEAAQQVIDGRWDDQFVVDIFQTGSGTSTNMNANEVIANLATEILGGKRGDKLVHPNDHVNMGQSSNDVIPTAMHISAREEIEKRLLPAMEYFYQSLTAKAQAFDDVLKSGRTHLMDATPVRMEQEFSGYASQIDHGMRRVKQASEELAELALGGTATGTGLNRHPQFPDKAIPRINQMTQLTFREAENHFEAQGARDAYVSAAGALNTLATSLMKIVNDIRWMASGPTSGLYEISIPAVQPGSSIMPGKVNPVMNEAVMMVCARVMGNLTTITIGGQHGNFELNTMMPVMAHAMLESIKILTNSMDAFRVKCLDGIEANRWRCQELLELNPAIATALAPIIGYDKAAEIAKLAAKERIPVREAAIKLGYLTPEELERYLDIRKMTEPGIPGVTE